MKSIHIEIIHNGQQLRAYGPNVAEAIITIEPEQDNLQLALEKEWALRYFKRAVCSYEEDPPHPFCFELKSAERLEKNKWRIRAERRWDD